MPTTKPRLRFTLAPNHQAALDSLTQKLDCHQNDFLRLAVLALDRVPLDLLRSVVAAGQAAEGSAKGRQAELRPQQKRHPKSTRRTLRLTEREDKALQAAAAAYGLPPSTFAVRVLRSVCLRAPNLLDTEIAAVGRSVRELHSIGVNLNQIARRLNENPNYIPGAVLGKQLECVTALVGPLADRLTQLMRGSIERWA